MMMNCFEPPKRVECTLRRRNIRVIICRRYLFYAIRLPCPLLWLVNL